MLAGSVEMSAAAIGIARDKINDNKMNKDTKGVFFMTISSLNIIACVRSGAFFITY